jgi:hypothetical protein
MLSAVESVPDRAPVRIAHRAGSLSDPFLECARPRDPAGSRISFGIWDLSHRSRPARVETALSASPGWREAQTATKKLNSLSLAVSRHNFLLLHSTFVRLAQTFIAARSMVRSLAVSHLEVPPVNGDRHVCQEALCLDASLAHNEDEP